MPRMHAFDLNKATTKSNGVGVPVVQTPIDVTADVLSLLNTGDSIIREVHQMLPYGAGNQTSDMKNTPGAGWRTAAAQLAYGALSNSPTNFNPSKPQHIAGATLGFQSGNCQDQAALVYILLRESLGPNYRIEYGCSPNYHHSFCLLGMNGEIDHARIIVVDPWPKYAQAVRWIDHFTYPDWQIYVGKTGAGTGRGTKIQNALNKYTNQAFINAVANQALQVANYQANWNHKWASRSQQVIRYRDPMDIS